MRKSDSMGWSPKHFKDVHGGVLDAHTKSPGEMLRTGEYHRYPWSNLSATQILTADRLYASPILVSRDIRIDRLAVHPSTEAGQNVRIGIYNLGTNLYPGTLKKDVGALALSGTSPQAVAISPALVLSKGIYFIAAVSDGTPTLRAMRDEALVFALGYSSTDFALSNGVWMVTFSYAALPDPFTAGGTLTNLYAFTIPYRVFSLD